MPEEEWAVWVDSLLPVELVQVQELLLQVLQVQLVHLLQVRQEPEPLEQLEPQQVLELVLLELKIHSPVWAVWVWTQP